MDRMEDAKRAEEGKRLPIPRTGLYAIVAVMAAAAGIISSLLFFGPDGRGKVGSSPFDTSAERRGDPAIGKIIRPSLPLNVPDLTFADADGRIHRLSEWRGKTVLLNLWATWCAPCKVEMPLLDRLQAKLGGERFAVLAISTDRTGPKQPGDFFASVDIRRLTLYNDKTAEASVLLKASGLPLTVILDHEGREVARLLGPADWDSAEAASLIEDFLRQASSAG